VAGAAERRAGGPEIDVNETIDKLEALVLQARRLPFGTTVLLGENEVLDLIEEVRMRLPDEIKQARWTVTEQQRILTESHGEAGKIVTAAQDKATQLLQDQELVRRAEQQASVILREAGEKAAEVRHNADEYVVELMTQFEAQLSRQISQVRKGLEALKRPAPEDGGRARQAGPPEEPVRARPGGGSGA
jgi:vacuolar-type H+-ATPase subunit H